RGGRRGDDRLPRRSGCGLLNSAAGDQNRRRSQRQDHRRDTARIDDAFLSPRGAQPGRTRRERSHGSPARRGRRDRRRVTAAALTIHNAYPFMQMGWPVLADLSKSNFIYPSSCVATSRALIKSSGPMVERFLRGYTEAIRLIKKDTAFAERTIRKWQRETDPLVVKK